MHLFPLFWWLVFVLVHFDKPGVKAEIFFGLVIHQLQCRNHATTCTFCIVDGDNCTPNHERDGHDDRSLEMCISLSP
jgi:hypothetical protein